MKTEKPRYKGELNKPICVGSIPIETTDEKHSQWLEQDIEREMIEKLLLLMEHYEITDKDDYFSLALALAKDHVKGFQVVRAALKLKHGNWGAVIRDTKPTIWPPERLLILLNDVEEAKQRHGFSTDRKAIRFVMLKGEWSRPIDRDEQKWLETLESRLHDAKRIKREERGGGPALDPASAAALRELEDEVARAQDEVARAQSAASVYAALPLELRFTALCLPLSSKIPEIKRD
jgi:hypothetical protein